MTKPKFFVVLSSDMKLASRGGQTILEFDDAIGLEVHMTGADGQYHLVVAVDGAQDGNVLALNTSFLDSKDSQQTNKTVTTIPVEW
jgi:hypothetical protein